MNEQSNNRRDAPRAARLPQGAPVSGAAEVTPAALASNTGPNGASRVRAEVIERAKGLGLSTKLLLLTTLFVMLAEVLIFVPSVANFRKTWLMERLAAAQIASLAAEAAPNGELPKMLRDELLNSAQVKGVALRRNEQRVLILSADMPEPADRHYDLRTETAADQIFRVADVFLGSSGRMIRVIGQPGFGAGDFIEIIMPIEPLQSAMYGFALRILGLSIVISLIAATMVYLALNWLLVRPMMRVTASIMRFRQNPEDASRIIAPSGRSDEIGLAERELAAMQGELASLLQQKSRLAALGLAVSKINHDLRNMLATAQLMSDRLQAVPDPTVQRLVPKLVGSLDRAIRLCAETLKFGQAREAPPRRVVFPLRRLVEEVGDGLALPRPGAIDWRIEIDPGLKVDADRDQLYRVLSNICRNAVQVLSAGEGAGDGQGGRDSVVDVSGAGEVAEISATPVNGLLRVAAGRDGAAVLIEISDNGPGLPAAAREHLFQAFQSSQRKGGTGLGLAIAAELVRAHGGDLQLVDRPGLGIGSAGNGAGGNAGATAAPGSDAGTSRDTATGACFRIRLPDHPRPSAAGAKGSV